MPVRKGVKYVKVKEEIGLVGKIRWPKSPFYKCVLLVCGHAAIVGVNKPSVTPRAGPCSICTKEESERTKRETPKYSASDVERLVNEKVEQALAKLTAPAAGPIIKVVEDPDFEAVRDDLK
jgi:hypothetical protein